jgi:hypothetical protein
MSVQATFAATLVDEWVRAGVTDAVVCPGSRSTPMALALARGWRCTSTKLDERSAGFFAIGLSLATVCRPSSASPAARRRRSSTRRWWKRIRGGCPSSCARPTALPSSTTSGRHRPSTRWGCSPPRPGGPAIPECPSRIAGRLVAAVGCPGIRRGSWGTTRAGAGPSEPGLSGALVGDGRYPGRRASVRPWPPGSGHSTLPGTAGRD